MRGMNSGSVDLIYLDPPFNSNANYAAPIGSKAAGAAFKDTWILSDVDVEWINLIEAKHPALYRVLLAAQTDSDKSYLAYMAARLLEMRRILKPTGSIYLHCDPTMSHYLKLVMDAIFGRRNFRNEITWKRNSSHNDSKTFGNVKDTILFYGANINIDAARVPHDAAYIKKFYRHTDGVGLYRADNLTAKGLSGGGYSYDFKGHMGPWRYPEHRMLALEHDGRIHMPKKAGGVPCLKRYLHENKGKPLSNLWLDIPPLQGSSREKTGYPTQKPLALLRRIIAASSNPGDVVLDPFCGCATTLVAADRLQRQWAGIDLSAKAAELVVRRLGEEAPHGKRGRAAALNSLLRNITHRTDIPHRTDIMALKRYNHPDNRKFLYGEQGGHCAGCGEHFEARHLEVDHIIARQKGGTDHIGNLQLLCGSCNRIKGARGMEYLRSKLQIAA